MADEVKQQPAAPAPTTGSSSTGSAGHSAPSSGGYQRREGSSGGSSRPYAGSRPQSGPGAGGAGRDSGRKFFRRKKVCKFCVEKIDAINYKDVRLLGQFVAERGKIIPRRLSGVCTPHQRRVSAAIKQARNIALLPFSARG
jgi:small subunit ribosomal protein S18